MTATPALLLTETLLGLCDAARRLPPARGGRPVHLSCALRWITARVPGPDGQRVRLEGVRVGGRWLTSEEALARWAERLTPRLDKDPAPPPHSSAKRRRASERAAAELERRGV